METNAIEISQTQMKPIFSLVRFCFAFIFLVFSLMSTKQTIHDAALCIESHEINRMRWSHRFYYHCEV